MCNKAKFLILFLPSLLLIPLCLKTRIYLLLLSKKLLLKWQGKCFISEMRSQGNLIQTSKFHTLVHKDNSSAVNACMQFLL